MLINVGKYLADFQNTPKRTLLPNRGDRLIKDISVDECAKLCVEEESLDCASFAYCGNSTTCRLSTTAMKNVGQVTSTANLWCDVYNSKLD